MMDASDLRMANPNHLPPRQAMGQPPRLVDRLGADVLSRHADLLRRDARELAAMIEADDMDFDRRFAIGTALGYLGDPRIAPDDPAMVRLEGGTVRLGLRREGLDTVVARWRHVGVQRDWIEKECPEHEAHIAPFAIARFPVTNLEFRRFMEDTGADCFPTSWLLGSYPHHLSNHPVWTVTPQAADAYAAWLARRTGRPYRLPTESEWEYAASHGDGREFPWGNEFDATRANTLECGPLCTTPVGIYPGGRTRSGIDDMAGNVEEFTADAYAPYPGGSLVEDDLHQRGGSYRVARGGSFSRYADLARCRRRHGFYDSPIYAIGFRLAMTI